MELWLSFKIIALVDSRINTFKKVNFLGIVQKFT